MSMATLISRSKNYGQCIRCVPLNVAATFAFPQPLSPPPLGSPIHIPRNSVLFKTVVLSGDVCGGWEGHCDMVYPHLSRPRSSESAEINVDGNVDFAP